MYENIDNFSQMVKDYYSKLGLKDMEFVFLHINIIYTYVELNSRLIDVNADGIPVYNNGKITKKEMIFLPVVLKHNDYENLFAHDEDYSKRTFNIQNTIDAGTSYNFNYAGIYKQIGKVIPKQCHMINDAEIDTISKINGYEKIFWDVQDENAHILKDYELGPNWVTKVYGIKMLEEEKTNVK